MFDETSFNITIFISICNSKLVVIIPSYYFIAVSIIIVDYIDGFIDGVVICYEIILVEGRVRLG